MNAADVLADTYGKWEMNARTMAGPVEGHLVAALLAHGEQGDGVTIEADGEMHPKDPPMTTRLPDGTLWAIEQTGYTYPAGGSTLFRLVPLSDEAGDQGTWMGGGLEITYPSDEAGDTDA